MTSSSYLHRTEAQNIGNGSVWGHTILGLARIVNTKVSSDYRLARTELEDRDSVGAGSWNSVSVSARVGGTESPYLLATRVVPSTPLATCSGWVFKTNHNVRRRREG